MKNPYSFALRRFAWQRLCATVFTLLSFALAAQAQSITFTPNTERNFGQVAVGLASAPEAITVTGSGLSGDITVNAPAQFEVSTFAAGTYTSTVTLAPAGGNIFVRFRPNTGGTVPRTVTGNLNAVSFATFTFATPVPLRGEAVAGTPTLTATPTSSTSFGDQIINTTSSPRDITVTGFELGADVTVTAPAGFLVRFNGGAYASSVTVPTTGGNKASNTGTINATVQVVFAPTAVQLYGGNVTFQSGTASSSVAVSGNGVPVPASLTITPDPASFTFGTTPVGSFTAAQTFVVNGSALTSNVTITAPSADFQVRVGNSTAFASTATIVPQNGSVTNETVEVRFTPASPGTKSGSVQVTATNAPTRTVTVSGTATASSGTAALNVDPTTLPFGTVTASGSANTLTFTVSGTDLGTNDITLTPTSPNIELRNLSAGGSIFASGPLNLTPTNGTVTPTTIEVRLVGPIVNGGFSGRIDVASTGVPTIPVNVSATSNGNVSDINITNPNGSTFTFATRPNTTSVPQSFRISGTNLLQDIIVAPVGSSAGFFELSENYDPGNPNDPATIWTSSLTLERVGGSNVPQQEVYIRFMPGNQAVIVNAIIRATSSPAPERSVSVTGISQPTVRLNQTIGNLGTTVVKNTVSAPRTVRLEAFLLTGPLNLFFPADPDPGGLNPSKTPQFEFSVNNGTSYVKNTGLITDADGNLTQNLLVRYAPTRVGDADQALRFQNSALNGGAAFSLVSGNGTATGFAIAEEPTAQSTATVTRTPGSTTATISFNLIPPTGQTFGQNRLIIASRVYNQANPLPTSLFPFDKESFDPGVVNPATTNYVYGNGDVIEGSTGTFVVFNGAANNFTVEGLDPNTSYSFFAFEYNDDGLLGAENYKVPNNQPQLPLPVELISFTAKLRNGRVNLDWATAMEKNNRGFEVQRSQNGTSFTTLGFVAGNGNSASRRDYSYVDAQPLSGTSYYRLKQIDEDGTASLSPVAVVSNGGKIEVNVYPNPVQNVLNVRLPETGTETSIVVTDLLGRVVMNTKLSANGTVDTSNLRAGNYIVTVINGDSKTNHKIVKQ